MIHTDFIFKSSLSRKLLKFGFLSTDHLVKMKMYLILENLFYFWPEVSMQQIFAHLLLTR